MVGEEALEVLKAYGLPLVPGGLATDAATAAAVAGEMGYPVVLKIISPDWVHKSDWGGVRLNITTAAELVGPLGGGFGIQEEAQFGGCSFPDLLPILNEDASLLRIVKSLGKFCSGQAWAQAADINTGYMHARIDMPGVSGLDANPGSNR